MYFDRLFNRDGYILVTKHLTTEFILFNHSIIGSSTKDFLKYISIKYTYLASFKNFTILII